jgi:hypothetical protein
LFNKFFLIMVLCLSLLINGCIFSDNSPSVGTSSSPRFIIEGTLPVVSAGTASAPAGAADFGALNKYSIGLYSISGANSAQHIEGPEISGSAASIAGGKYSISVPLVSTDVYGILIVRDKKTGCAIYKTLIGMLPKPGETGSRQVTLKNVSVDAETTAKTLLLIEKKLVPSARMTSEQTNEITFASIPACVSMNAVAPASDITGIAAAVKLIADIIASSDVSDVVKKQIFPSANNASEILSAFIRTVRSQDIYVKNIVPEGTSISINGTLIDKNTQDASVKLIVTGIISRTEPSEKPAADHFDITNIAGDIQAGATFEIKITAKDKLSNILKDFSSEITLSDLSSSLTVISNTGFINGVWSGVAAITKSFKSDRIKAVSGTVTAENASFNIVPAAPSKLVMAIQPSENAIKDEAFSIQPSVKIQDLYGNDANTSGIAVTVSLKSGIAGTLGVNLVAKTNSEGIAVFSGLSYNDAGAIILEFNSPGLAKAESNQIIVDSGLIHSTPPVFSCADNGTYLTITGYTGTGGAIQIPSGIYGKPVKAIGSGAFSGKTNITGVVIPEGVTSIGGSAFEGCTALTSVVIPAGVTSIDDKVFKGCTSLTSVAIPSSVSSIGRSVFENCAALTSITIPPGVTTIYGFAFSNCPLLAAACFYGNSPNSSQAIDPNAKLNMFSGCAAWFKIYYFSDKTGWTDPWGPYTTVAINAADFTYTGETDLTITGYKGAGGAVNIPFSLDGKLVKAIGDNAFSAKTAITSVFIPYGITSIGAGAFESCTGLTSVTIPASVASIGNNAFKGCLNLVLARFDGDAPAKFGTDVFSNCSKNFIIYYYSNKNGWTGWNIYTAVANDFAFVDNGTYITITAYKGDGGAIAIPPVITGKPVTAIDDKAFFEKTSITSVIIPNGVASIGVEAFCGCSGLASVTIPASVTSIGTGAFNKCSAITSAAIPVSVTSIGNYAFANCTGLTSATIPASVTSIGGSVFEGCTALTSITIPTGVKTIGAGMLKGCGKLTSVTIPASVTSIGNNAFEGCSGLTSVTIPASVISTGNGTFKGCTALTSITLPVGVKTIGDELLKGCSKLTSVTIPASVTSIGGSAFGGCSGLTSVTIPSSVTSIGNNAFEGCSNLAFARFDGNAPSTFGTFVFSNCAVGFKICYISDKTGWTNPWNTYTTGMIGTAGFIYVKNTTGLTITGYMGTGETAEIPALIYDMPVTAIGDRAFYGKPRVTSVIIPDGVTSIGVEAFYICSGLASVTIPSSVTDIGSNAFEGCGSLTSITIPAGVKTISAGMLKGCVKLTSVTIPSSVADIGGSAFENCGSLTSVTIPAGVKTISAGTLKGCVQLTSVTIPSSVTSIGSSAFEGCTALASIAIPSSVTSIGGSAFENCTALTSVAIPAGVTSIDDKVFKGCTALTSVTIPSSVTTIGRSSFENCTALTSITIPSSVTTIFGFAFSNCKLLASARFYGNPPNSSQAIDPNAKLNMFSGCAAGFKIYYFSDKTGWTNPWGPYTTVAINPGD